MDYVENYFQSGVQDPTQQVRRTDLPPIYFQHLGRPCLAFRALLLQPPAHGLTWVCAGVGHSLTIIGFEKLKNGTKQLLVFDPSFHDSWSIVRLIGRGSFKHPAPDLALSAYRRGGDYLKKYKSFELVTLIPS